MKMITYVLCFLNSILVDEHAKPYNTETQVNLRILIQFLIILFINFHYLKGFNCFAKEDDKYVYV